MTPEEQIFSKLGDLEKKVSEINSADELMRPMKREVFARWAGVSLRTIDRWKSAGLKHMPGPLFTKKWAAEFFNSIAEGNICQ